IHPLTAASAFQIFLHSTDVSDDGTLRILTDASTNYSGTYGIGFEITTRIPANGGTKVLYDNGGSVGLYAVSYSSCDSCTNGEAAAVAAQGYSSASINFGIATAAGPNLTGQTNVGLASSTRSISTPGVHVGIYAE